MIQNGQQLRITKGWIRRFKSAIAANEVEPNLSGLTRRVNRDAAQSELEALQGQVREYRERKAKQRPPYGRRA